MKQPAGTTAADVVVIGAGPAGSACALGLARLGCDVALVSARSPNPRGGETCGAATFRALAAAGFPPLDAEVGIAVEAFQSAWGSDDVDERRLRFWTAGAGRVLDRPRFEHRLRADARDAGARQIEACWITGGIPDRNGWTLHAAIEGNPLSIRASFVVEATGRGARSVLQPGTDRTYSDRLVCLHSEISDPGSERRVIRIEACASGWWYTAPTPGRRRMIALFTDADLVGPPAARGARFHAALARTKHVRPPEGIAADTEVRLCDARTSARNLVWRHRWISIGDATWSIDPLSGAGIARGVADGAGAATAIASHLRSGDSSPLRAHATAQGMLLRAALQRQRRYYGLERRWPSTPFWSRRQPD